MIYLVPFQPRNLLSLWKITMFDSLIGNSSLKCPIFHSKVLDQRDPPDTLRCQTSLLKPQKQWRSMEDVMGIIYIAISRFFSSKPCLIAPPGMFLGFYSSRPIDIFPVHPRVININDTSMFGSHPVDVRWFKSQNVVELLAEVTSWSTTF